MVLLPNDHLSGPPSSFLNIKKICPNGPLQVFLFVDVAETYAHRQDHQNVAEVMQNQVKNAMS